MAISAIPSLPPETIYDIYERLGFPKKEVCRGTQVCKDWYLTLGHIGIWRPFFTEAGLPLVEGMDTGLSSVYSNLFSRSLNYGLFEKYYGPVRDISPISKKKYDKFENENDSFIPSEEPQKKICQTSWLVIDASYVYPPFDQVLFDKINASTNQKDKAEKIEDGKVMKIPFTLRNRKVVIEHTNPDKKIFSIIFGSDVLEHCNSAPEKTGFWVMREEVVYQNEIHIVQKELIEGKEGYKLVPLRVRVLFNAMKICETGTCPDNTTYAHTADMAVDKFSKAPWPVFIGGFAICNGLGVGGADFSRETPGRGVVAGFPAQD